MNARVMLICGICLCVSITRAATNYVAQGGQTPSGTFTDWSSAASNIQEAIDAADVGNTVMVSNGTYNLTSQISIAKRITVRSLNGKTSTFVNGNYPAYSNRCFLVNDAAAIVDGFTISNGCLNSDNWLGGGVRIDAGTVRNCSIISNTITGNGLGSGCPGVYMVDAGCVLSNCLVALNNSAMLGIVGGVDLWNGARIDGCNIVSNRGHYYGGIYSIAGTVVNSTCEWNTIELSGLYAAGIYMQNDGGIVSNCVVRKNYSGPAYGVCYGIRCGGGLVTDSTISEHSYNPGQWEDQGVLLTDGTVSRCTISGNGGGMTIYGGTVSNCTITDSKAYGGVDMFGGIMRNCLVYGNSSAANGSGVLTENASALVENCTIAKNDGWYTTVFAVAVGAAGGTIKNCIIYNNTYGGGGGIYNWYVATPSTAGFTNCCTTPTNDLPGSGNISDIPAFVDSGTSNFRLSTNSPCINKGLNQSWMTSATDRDGKQRVDGFSRQVDMGCYEFLLHGALFCVR